jgi:hypothetical protein
VRPPAARAVLVHRLLDILSLQVDAFEELHCDLAFDVERVKALQLLVRSLGTLEDLFKRMGETDETFAAGSGDVVEFRSRLTRQIDSLGKDGEGGKVAGTP